MACIRVCLVLKFIKKVVVTWAASNNLNSSKINFSEMLGFMLKISILICLVAVTVFQFYIFTFASHLASNSFKKKKDVLEDLLRKYSLLRQQCIGHLHAPELNS